MSNEVRLRPGRLVVFFAAVVAVAILVSLVFLLPDSTSVHPSHLDDDRHVREALGWPWGGFPPILECEREALESHLEELGDLVNMRLPIWETNKSVGPLNFGNGVVKANLEAAQAYLVGDESDDLQGGNLDYHNELVQALESNLGGLWQVRYHLALLRVRDQYYKRAYRLLQSASNCLPPTASLGMYDPLTQRDIREARILTEYASGTVSLRLAEATSDAEQEDWRARSIKHCRRAVQVVTKLPGSYAGYGVNRPWAPFHLCNADLSSHAMVNSLVVAYLRHEDYTYSEAMPSGTPRYSPDMEEYREKCFSLTNQTAADDALGRTFRRLFGEFYGSNDRRREPILWALSNAIDFHSYSRHGSPDPYLRYNTARLLAFEGHHSEASELLGSTHNLRLLGESECEARRSYDRLETMTRLMAGRSQQRRSQQGSGCSTTSIWEDFVAMYPDSPQAKYPPADLGDDDLNHLVAHWLFFKHFRELLGKEGVDDQPGGQLNQFLEEHRALIERTDYPDLFQRWRSEVVEAFADSALVTMNDLRARGEHAKADVVAELLRNPSVFSGEAIRKTFSHPMEYYIWVAKDRSLVYTKHFLLVVAAWVALAAWGVSRAYGQLLTSGHQRERSVTSAGQLNV